MNIVVCVKQVPNIVDVKINDTTKNLVREGVPSIINPFDENGMELALQLKEQYGGTVTAISMGPNQAAKELEHCLAMGADKALLLCDRKLAGADTLATCYSLSNTIALEEYDLIICGAEAIDSCTAQVGPGIAQMLGIPFVTNVLDVKKKEGKLEVSRDTREYVEKYEVRLPALICVLKGINSPRACRDCDKTVTMLDAAHLEPGRIGMDGSPTRVVDVQYSNSRPMSYVDVDDSLNAEERVDYMISGGVETKRNPLARGTCEHLAGQLYEMIGY